MTFKELCVQTARECGEGVTYEQMQRILATHWRMVIEELLAKPGESRLMLNGLLQIYTKKKRLNCGVFENGKAIRSEQQIHYCFRLKPSAPLKKVLQGEADIRSLKVGNFPLYFDKTELKRPDEDFKRGEIQLDNMKRKKSIAEREGLRKFKEQAEQEKIRKSLPED